MSATALVLSWCYEPCNPCWTCENWNAVPPSGAPFVYNHNPPDLKLPACHPYFKIEAPADIPILFDSSSPNALVANGTGGFPPLIPSVTVHYVFKWFYWHNLVWTVSGDVPVTDWYDFGSVFIGGAFRRTLQIKQVTIPALGEFIYDGPLYFATKWGFTAAPTFNATLTFNVSTADLATLALTCNLPSSGLFSTFGRVPNDFMTLYANDATGTTQLS